MQQLSRIVRFHKALSDPTRIRILVLLAKGPLHGQALAGKLGMTPPTITHHMAKLRDAGLVRERRDKNTIYFSLEETTLEEDARAIVEMVLHPTSKEKGEIMSDKAQKERLSVIKNFFAADGTLKRIPTQRKKRLIVLEHMLQGLKLGTKYTEKEINEYIFRFHEDFATIRREFIIHQHMFRENGIYELNPPEMWAKIEGISS